MRKILILVTALFLVACDNRDPRVDKNIESIGAFGVTCIDGVKYLTIDRGNQGYGLTAKFGRDGEVSLCDLKGEWQ